MVLCLLRFYWSLPLCLLRNVLLVRVPAPVKLSGLCWSARWNLLLVCAPLLLWMLVVCGPLPLEVLLVFASLFVNVLLVRVPVPGSWLALLANSSAPQDSLTTRARTLQNLPRMRCKALLNLLWIRTHSQSHIGAMGTAPLPLRCVTGLCRSASLDFSGLRSCPPRAYALPLNTYIVYLLG